MVIHREPVSLMTAPSGATVRVASIHGGREFKNRMSSMGLHAGFELNIVQNPGGTGPVVVSVGGARLGLGRGMADKVMVYVL